MASMAFSHYRTDDRVPALARHICHRHGGPSRTTQQNRRPMACYEPRARPKIRLCPDRSRCLDFRVRVDLGAPRREFRAARLGSENGRPPRSLPTSRATTAISPAALFACSGEARRGAPFDRVGEPHSAAGPRGRNKWARTRYRCPPAPPPLRVPACDCNVANFNHIGVTLTSLRRQKGVPAGRMKVFASCETRSRAPSMPRRYTRSFGKCQSRSPSTW